jgi:DNA-directed RNA polymerase subunit M/transcription elongation factor TFIIS
MLWTIVVFLIAFGWLLFETNGLKITIGKVTPKILLLPTAKPILMLPEAKNRYSLSMSMSEWDTYYKDHAYELKQQQELYARQQAEIKAHYCPICKAHFEVYVKTRTFVIGNSTFTLTGCPECIKEYRDKIEKIQTEKHKPIFIYPKSDNLPCGKKFWEWDEEEYPHTIELTVNDKTISFNGDYKPGCIKQFVKANK